jgi:hypothetical protein
MADTTRVPGPRRTTSGARRRPAAAAEPDAGVDVSSFERAERAAHEAPSANDADGVCPVSLCPIGMALSAMQGTKPDAVAHLLSAGREFLLAAKAVLDARAEEAGGSRTLERIEIG